MAASSTKRALLLTDAVFSMNGGMTPLPQWLAPADCFDAWLVAGDAHG